MIFAEQSLKGAFLIQLAKHEDERGFFARSFCSREFQEHGLNANVVQCNIAFNRKKGTVRGMHYQKAPAREAKLVRCVSGAIFDVIVDLRNGSPTFRKHLALELSAANRLALYIPEGFAHGMQTLHDSTEVFYQMSEFYTPGSAAGFRYDDPKFGISWPLAVTEISAQDLAWGQCDV